MSVLVVDPTAVAHNVRVLRGGLTDGAALMAVVKADGFGLGAEAVARAALGAGAASLGVATLAEACALRATGITAPVLAWREPADADWAAAAAGNIEVAAPTVAHLLAMAPTRRPLRVHLHGDVGLARDGAAPADWVRLAYAAARLAAAGRIRVVGIMGHLANADTGPDAPGRAAYAELVGVCRRAGLLTAARHLAGTSAVLTDPASHLDLVRVGAGLCGIDPTGGDHGLRWAATLRTRLTQVRHVPAGTGVGYGHAHRTTAPTWLGLLPLGYADGLPRAASGRAEVLVRGVRRPVVGRISMDQAVVDLGGTGAGVGEAVTVFGAGADGAPTPADWARWSGTLPHEILCGIGPRVPRAVASDSLAVAA